MRFGRAGGFTLLELLVVMVIIGMLAGYVAPRYFEHVGKSEVKVARAQLDSLEKALAAYRIDTGHFPSTQLSLQALIRRPPDESRWSGPYLARAVPVDPWGNQYVYRHVGSPDRDYVLMSLGSDGQVGGQGLAADIDLASSAAR